MLVGVMNGTQPRRLPVERIPALVLEGFPRPVLLGVAQNGMIVGLQRNCEGIVASTWRMIPLDPGFS